MTTPLALGTMHFGTRLDEPAARAVLDRFAELGGTWLDTSNNYAYWQSDSGFGGQSELVLGRWLADNPGSGVRISTKVGAQPTIAGGGDWDGGHPDWIEGLGAPAVRTALRESLERLGRERVDLYWAHVEDRREDPDDLVQTFGGLVTDGLVGSWGVSNHPSWLLERLTRHAGSAGVSGPSAYQQRYSYLQPLPDVPVADQPITHGMLTSDGRELLRREPGLTGWIYTALLRGAYDRSDLPLSPEYRHPGNEQRLSALRKVADGRGSSRSQVVLAWLVGGEPALVPIVGVSSVAQLEQVWTGVTSTLSEEERALLDGAASSG